MQETHLGVKPIGAIQLCIRCTARPFTSTGESNSVCELGTPKL